MPPCQWEKLVLGIDAAWTATQPSGVALAGFDGDEWRCIAVAPGYPQFLELASGMPHDWRQPPGDGLPDISHLIATVNGLTGGIAPDVIAVDMPLSRQTITGRRVADNAISREFGARGCAVHSPTVARPGPIAASIRQGCEAAGFHLATEQADVASVSSLIEVYPHTAVLELLDLDFRHPYKVSRAGSYWRGTTVNERKFLLINSMQVILDALGEEIRDIDLVLPGPVDIPSLSYLKRYEDAIDALVCCWVAIRFLRGECKAYGDATAAIWSPV